MRPLEIEMIRDEIRRVGDKARKAGYGPEDWPSGPDAGIFRTKSANEWLKHERGKPAARSLFGGFWYEGELCILFADTNLGKSILAVQIGDIITRAGNMGPFTSQADIGTRVLYIDFELSSKQFEARYVHERWGSFQFADSFLRSEFNPEADDPVFYDNYEDNVKDEISRAITKTKARVLIIDNITFMRRGTERAKDALPLMKMLKALKTKHKLSVLVLAHTPKRDPYKPLTVNDLQGSKMLINFADSAFAIGQSQTEPGLRYLKQIKQRNQQEQYGETNVCIIRQEKHLNFLRYNFECYAHEQDHLRRPEPRQKAMLKQRMIELDQKGVSYRQIAIDLGVHHTTVSRILQKGKGKY